MDKGIHDHGIAGSHLRNLLTARCVAILGLTIMLFLLLSRGIEEAPGNGFLVSLGALTLLTVASFLRLAASWQVTELEFLVQLVIDVSGVSALLYFSGGAYNPAIIYLMVPVVFAALLLPAMFARAVTLLACLSLVTLVFLHVPVPPFIAEPTPLLLGIWSALLFCAAVIGWFAVDIAGSGRTAEDTGAGSTEVDERHLKAVARIAAGTAEELGTPLATMSALVEDLAHFAAEEKHREDFHLLAEQLEHCGKVLDKLSRTARLTEGGGEKRWVELVGFAESTVRHWQAQRPEAEAEVTVSGKDESPRIAVDVGLAQVLEHLLHNAADVSSSPIRIDVNWDDLYCYIRVDDCGPGFPAELLGQGGTAVVVPGKKGLGVGLLISHATISRYNGQLELTNRKDGGASARIRLPISE